MLNNESLILHTSWFSSLPYHKQSQQPHTTPITSPNGIFTLGAHRHYLCIKNNNNNNTQTFGVRWELRHASIKVKVGYGTIFLVPLKNTLIIDNYTAISGSSGIVSVFDSKISIRSAGIQLQDDGNLYFIDKEYKKVDNGAITNFTW